MTADQNNQNKVHLAKPGETKKGEKDVCLYCGKEYVNYGTGMSCEQCKQDESFDSDYLRD